MGMSDTIGRSWDWLSRRLPDRPVDRSHGGGGARDASARDASIRAASLYDAGLAAGRDGVAQDECLIAWVDTTDATCARGTLGSRTDGGETTYCPVCLRVWTDELRKAYPDIETSGLGAPRLCVEHALVELLATPAEPVDLN